MLANERSPSAGPPGKATAAFAIAVTLYGLLLAGAASAQTRNVGPGVPDRPATAWPRPGGETFVFGGLVQGKQQVDVIGRREDRARYGVGGTENLLATWLLMPYGFALRGVARFESAPRFTPDPPLRDHALWLDELYASWAGGPLDLYGGKIHPRFGFAWDRGPGLYGTDFGREYELTEKIGFGARLYLSDFAGLAERIGSHTLQFEAFHADRSVLSGSLFARRYFEGEAADERRADPSLVGRVPERIPRLFWRNSRGLGAPDNASGLAGRVLSLGGFGIPTPLGPAGYTLAWSEREPGEDATTIGRGANEQGYAAGAFATVALPRGLELAPLAEWVRLDEAGGFRGRTAEWLTAGAALRGGPWTFAYAWMGNREADAPRGERGVRSQHTASATYDLAALTEAPVLRGLSLTLGWRQLRQKIEGRSDDFGVAVTWEHRF